MNRRDTITERLEAAVDRYRSSVIKSALRTAARRREDILRSRAAQGGYEAWPVLPTELDGVHTGELPIGTTPNGVRLVAPVELVNGTSLLLGVPGSGKTVLALRLVAALNGLGVRTFWIDSKTNPSEVLQCTLPFLTPEESALTLEPPLGVSPPRWLGRLWWTLESQLFIADAVGELEAAHRRVRQAMPSDRQVCLHDLHHALQEWPWSKGSYREEQLRGTAKSTLRRLVEGEHGLFTTTGMLPWATRLATSHGVWLGQVTPEAARVFVLLLMLAELELQSARGVNDRRLSSLFIQDDARWLVRSPGKSTSATDPAQYVHDLGHARGIGTMINVQNLAEIGDDLLRNLSTLVLVGPIHGDDVRRLREHLQLDERQADYLQHQSRHRAVIWSAKLAYTYAFPVALDGPESLPDPASARAAQSDARLRLLAGHAPAVWTPLPPAPFARNRPSSGVSSAGSPATPAPVLRKLATATEAALRTVLAEPYRYQEEIGKLLGVRGRKLTDVRDELVQAGFIRPVTVGRAIAWEALPAAAAHLGTTFQQLPGRGGFAHRWLQARAAAWLRRTCRRVEVEFQLQSGGRLDVYGECPGGELLAIEIVLDLSYLDETIDKLRGFSGEPTLVAKDARARDAIRKAAGGASLWSTTAPVALTIAEFLKMSGT